MVDEPTATASEPGRLQALGKRLKQARLLAGMSQEEAGSAVGVPPDTISRWERGCHDPLSGHMDRVSDLYGVSVDWLFGKALHRTGLKPGYTIVDDRAVARVRRAVARGETLADIEDFLRPPGSDIAWDVPQDVRVIGGGEAQKLHREIEDKLKILKSRMRTR